MTTSRTEKRPLADRLRERAERFPSVPGFLFFHEFLTTPKTIGAIIPTSQIAVDATLSHVDWDRCRLFVEYGPGTGVFTRSVLERARPDARIVAIDPNAHFIEHLHRTLPDPRLSLVRGSAADVESILASHGAGAADYVLSGLPFSTLPEGVGEAIIAATERSLAPGGTFLVYQYSLRARPLLEAVFDRVEVSRVWRCVPPLRLMRAIRTR